MDGAYSFHLAGIDLNDSDAGGDQFLSQGFGKAPHRCLSCTVYASSRVWLSSSNAADVDNVSPAAVGSLVEYRQDGLGHMYEACHVGLEHGVYIL